MSGDKWIPPPDAAAPEVVVIVEGVGETHDWGRSRVGDVRVFEEDVERVGDINRSG